MKRGDAVQIPHGVGRLWSVSEDSVVVEMEFQYLVEYPEGKVEVLEDARI